MALANFSDWLNRKPAGPKPRKPLKRTRVKPVSKKRRKDSAEYLKLRAGFLASHPHCEVARPKICAHRSRDVHHAQGRGPNYLNVNSWVSTCRACHDYIHQHPSWAREHGYLAK
jgi:hypothetical protein